MVSWITSQQASQQSENHLKMYLPEHWFSKQFVRVEVKKKASFQKPGLLVGREGFEPSANGLKVRCSTAELTAHFMDNFKA